MDLVLRGQSIKLHNRHKHILDYPWYYRINEKNIDILSYLAGLEATVVEDVKVKILDDTFGNVSSVWLDTLPLDVVPDIIDASSGLGVILVSGKGVILGVELVDDVIAGVVELLWSKIM